MAINFWEAQKRAKSKTTFYLILFVILTVLISFFVDQGMRYAEETYQPDIPWFGILFAALTFLVAWIQYLNFRAQGGSYVAKALGARVVSKQTGDFRERQLLNIVEEMAVASSLPVPPVYILSANQINAFAAGLYPHDAAIAVTEGTLNRLNRDELQGVVAHEFGHIYNGDMKISMRLAAMLMGFFFILYLGLRFLQFAPRQREEGKGGNPLVIAALLFILAGSITWFFGSILKSAISREREYLADACAVQFTRNPDGITNALRKIEREMISDMPARGDSYSHLYFNDNTAFSSLFQTHPPIRKRIAALLNREYIPAEWNIPD